MSLITITQNYGSNGLEVAKKVADGLDWDLFDDRKIQELAQGRGVSHQEFERFDEQAPGYWEVLFNNEPRMFLDLLESVIYDLASKGDGVIIGHGSQVLLRNFDCAFHVRLFASETHRADRIAATHGLTIQNGLDLIRKRDKEQVGYFKFAFHNDIDDPVLYDLIINTQKFDTATMASLVIAAAQSKAVTACDSSAIDWMDRLSLEKQVKAALIKGRADSPSLIINAIGNGRVQVSGVIASVEDKQRIESVIHALPGVSEVVFQAGVIRATSGE